jgi:WD40 repeat protein
MGSCLRVLPVVALLFLPQDTGRPRSDSYGDPLPEGAIARLGTVRFRMPQNWVETVLSPDGTVLAILVDPPQERESIQLFDTSTGRRVRSIPSEEYFIEGAPAFSPDGKTLASVTPIGEILLWNLDTGERRSVGGDPESPAIWFAFLPDLKRVVTMEVDEEDRDRLCVRDVGTGKRIVEFDGGEMGVWPPPFSFSGDGALLAAEGVYGTIRVFDTRTGKERWRLRIPEVPGYTDESRVEALSLSPDGGQVAAVVRLHREDSDGYEGGLVVQDVATGGVSFSLPPGQGRNLVCSDAVAFSPDGKWLVTGGTVVRGWEVSTWKEIFRAAPFASRIHFSADGRRLVTADEDFILRDGKTGKRLAGPDVIERRVLCVAHVGTGGAVATGELGGTVSLWEGMTGKAVRRLDGGPEDELDHGVWHLWSSPGGRFLAGASPYAGWTRVWDTARGDRLLDIQGTPLEVRLGSPYSVEGEAGESGDLAALAFSRDDLRIALGMMDGGIRVISLSDPKGGAERPNHEGPVGALAFTGEGTLLSWGWDSVLRLNGPGPGRRTHHGPGLVMAAFSPGGERLACGDGEGVLHVWDVATGEEILEGKALGCRFSRLEFCSDGGRLLIRGVTGLKEYRYMDSSIHYRVWDIERGEEVLWLSGKEGGGQPRWRPIFRSKGEGPRLRVPGRAAISPDGRAVVSDGVYGRTGLWEVATGGLIRMLPDEEGWYPEFAFSKDGERLVTSHGRGALVWDLHPPESGDDSPMLWASLAGGNPERAYEAIAALAASPEEAVEFIRDRIGPVPVLTDEEMRALVGDLDSPDFSRREEIQGRIEEQGDRAVPALKGALDGSPTPEMEIRIRGVLDALRTPIRVFPSVRLRSIRVIQVLERIGTEEACAILREVAEGAPHALRTLEARAALRRLESR